MKKQKNLIIGLIEGWENKCCFRSNNEEITDNKIMMKFGE